MNAFENKLTLTKKFKYLNNVKKIFFVYMYVI